MIVNKLTSIILYLFFSTQVLSQNISFKSSNFKSDKKGYKEAKKNIKEGDKYLNIGNEKILIFDDPSDDFKKALYFYFKADNFNSRSSELNYKISNCLFYTSKKSEGLKYINKAIELGGKLPNHVVFLQAYSLQLQSNYNEAKELFIEYKKSLKSKELKKYKDLVNKHILECSSALEFKNNEINVWIEKLEINSNFDEWSPCLSADGDLLIFSSNKPNLNSPNEYGEFDYEIYSSNLNNRKFDNIFNISYINTESDDISGGLSYDGQRLLLFMEENENMDIYESILEGEKWSKPIRKMGKKLKGANSLNNETFASYEPPDIKVYYVSDAGSNKNIFFSGIMNKERNIWGKGQSAGFDINTKFDESSVYIHPDGKTMFFSSKGHNSIGGFDIFISHLDELGHWSKPINIGPPINTPYDDLFFTSNASGRYAYISSNRSGGSGGYDIYKVTFKGEDKPMIIDYEDFLLSGYSKLISNEISIKKIDIEEKNLTVFKGKIVDKLSKDPIKAQIVIYNNTTGEEYLSMFSNSKTGKFLMSLPSGKNYGISATAENYLFHSENFNLPLNDGYNLVNKVIELKNINIGNEIILNNVFFETDRSDISSDSYLELDRLIDFLLDFPSIRIEISGHTDNIGSKSYNKLLSQRRADSVVKYILSKGINKSRIIAKGYGQEKPIEDNNTIDGRSKNRRTAFEIIEN